MIVVVDFVVCEFFGFGFVMVVVVGKVVVGMVEGFVVVIDVLICYGVVVGVEDVRILFFFCWCMGGYPVFNSVSVLVGWEVLWVVWEMFGFECFVVLLLGGVLVLLVVFVDCVTFDEKIEVMCVLLVVGVLIHEINCV